ncbi:hypothetical protein HIDPHFAB_02965 [Nocardioides sp. T2.26MG-1]|nr:hypothetical protein HIDPHFAB_02965 [Nocardioides sp. T2.26MG-1]
MCGHELGGPGGLPCDNKDEHPGKGRGCTHTGSTAPDRHDLTEAHDD